MHVGSYPKLEYGCDYVSPELRRSSNNIAPMLTDMSERKQLVPFCPRVAHENLDHELGRKSSYCCVGVEGGTERRYASHIEEFPFADGERIKAFLNL